MDDALRGLHMKAKPTLLVKENDLSVDLTLHDVPASLISEFAEKIVRPYYNGNLNAAIQDLIKKAIAEQDFILSHITHVRNSVEP
jgi:tagatose-1,6-bisphosphate aldolase non-catalytic subunit AgaZ/GatZ